MTLFGFRHSFVIGYFVILSIMPQSFHDIYEYLADLAEGKTAVMETSEYGLSMNLYDWTVETTCEFMDGLLARLAETNLWGEANRIPSGVIWRMNEMYFERGWLQNHARMKPRGYAGDFEMLQKICDGWQCDDGLGHAYDVYFQRQHAPHAVRSRTDLLTKKIVRCIRASESTCKILSIGSGPAVEISRAVDELWKEDRERLEIVLLDLDPAALEHATHGIVPRLADEQVHPVRENLFRLSMKNSVVDAMANSNFVFCSGLFDYLDEAHAVRMLQLMYQSLAPGGEMYAFNFGTNNPSRAYMEWIGNWYLIYRDRNQLADLATKAGISWQNYRIDAEPWKVNLFIHAWR